MQQIIFEFDTQYGVFRDALYLPDDHALTDDQIQALKQERLDNWLSHVDGTAARSPEIAPFVELNADYVDNLLDKAGLSASDVFFDLGCGAGSVLLHAAKKFGAKCVGIELNPDLVAQATARIEAEGMSDAVTVRHEDIRTADLTGATVVYMFMIPEAFGELQNLLLKLPAGTKIVSPHHGLDIGVAPQTVVGPNGVGYIWVR